MATRGLVIAAPTSGAGKTTVTLALLAALRAQGVSVVGGKAGPDYIDPAFHTAATGHPTMNFDAWAMTPDRLRAQAAEAPAELLIIEGAMGLTDGAGRAATGSAADLAEVLGLPVVLVVDAARAGAAAALPVAGARALRPGLRIAGVILNRLGSPRHGEIAARAIEALDIPVLGTLPRAPQLALPDRHLGLVQAIEHPDLPAFFARAANWVTGGCDLSACVAQAGPLLPHPAAAPAMTPPGQRVAIARDAAFAFAYDHMLADWRRAGAQLLPFSPLADAPPAPDADAIVLPGGYPELHAGKLAAASAFRAGMQRAAARQTVIYGECGGFMALGDGLVDAAGDRHRMLELLPLETSFAARKLTLGYRSLQSLGGPFPGAQAGHEFHYARITRQGDAPALFAAADADGTALGDIGLRAGSVCGSFAHVIASRADPPGQGSVRDQD